MYNNNDENFILYACYLRIALQTAATQQIAMNNRNHKIRQHNHIYHIIKSCSPPNNLLQIS